MVLRTLPHELPNMRNLLDAMAECRKSGADALGGMRPFCLTHKALSLLPGSVDTVAWFLAGEGSQGSDPSARSASGDP